MALNFTDRQARTIAAAITTVSALIILIAIGMLAALAALFLRTFAIVFLPLAVGAVAALVLRPFYEWLRTDGQLPLPVAVITVFLSALAPLGIFLYLFGQLAVDQLIGLTAQATGWWQQQGRTWLGEQLSVLIDNSGIAEQLQQVLGSQQTALFEWIQTIGGQAVTAGFGLARGIGALFSWAITPVYFAYFLTASRLKINIETVLPFLKQETRGDVVYLVHEFINIIVAFFRGQLIIAVLQGLLFAAGFSLVGLRYGFVIGLALGLLNIIPYLGSILGLAIAIPVALFQTDGGITTCLLVLFVFIVVQQIEGWFLTPKIMGDRTGLHFMAIIVAIFFWSTALGGILGLILAIPLTAFLASLWRLAREKYIPEIL
ncbi:MAG: AI-2E family transporter [Acidobacteriota bacterium]|nr:AI-2E family transporter [Acidobacteriota bacterium]